MIRLFITVGSAGVGKSTFIKNTAKKEDTIISPDNERRLAGDINNQSFSQLAFKNCYEQLEKVKDGDVYFDATSLSLKYINEIISHTKADEVNIILFENSRNPEFCKNNIHRDIAEGKDRSNVPDEVVDKMSERYCQLVPQLGQIKANIIKIK